MKKSDLGLVLATGIYSFVFYSQNAGVNFLLFTLCVVVLLGIFRPAVRREKRWLSLALLSILSSVFILVHASWLAILANCFALAALAGATMHPGSSVIINLLSAGGSIAGSPAFLAEGIYSSSRKQENTTDGFYLKNLLVYLIPLVLALIFFVIYRQANPLFMEFTRAINLDFITFNWFMFTLGGLLICYGLVKTKRFSSIDNWENRQDILPGNNSTFIKWDEKKAAVFLFLLLNLMLLFMNGLDINYLYLGAGLPEGITHKQFVHNGVGNLILSIILGISVIGYFFRGGLNFGENRTLKTLVYLWIVQNLFMVLSTTLRNEMYISEALLTYKRIGVFFWTGLAAAGLITTIYKVYAKKPAWYLIRANSAIALVVLVLSASIDWDKQITDFNLKHIGQVKDLDKRYLISLGETNFKPLYEIADDEGFENNIYYHYEFGKTYNNTDRLNQKLSGYLACVHEGDWRSFSFRRKRVMDDIRELNASGQITKLDLTRQRPEDLEPFMVLSNIKELALPDDFRINEKTVEEIAEFTSLEKIEMPTLSYPDLVHFVKLKQIRNLALGSLDNTALAFLRREMPGTAVSVNQMIHRQASTAEK